MTAGRERRAVITGLGTLTAAGAGRDSLAAQLLSGETHLSTVAIAAGDLEGNRPRLASQVGSTDLSPWLSPLSARRMSRPSKFAVVAARLAVDDAGLELDKLQERTVAVFMATSFGPTEFSERILGTIYQEGPEATSPSLFTESVANAPAAQVALAIRANGPNITVTQREAGPLIALGSATREIVDGRADLALVGSVDEVAPILHSALARFGALAGSRGGDPDAARPFDRRRDGFLLAEGASVLVLEREDRARDRGAAILARVGLTATGFDPDAPASAWSRDPTPLACRLGSRIERAGIAITGIDRIVSGASGARAGDRLEGLVLHSVWANESLPPILAPKGCTGEYGGGHLAAAVLAASGAPFAATPGFGELDSEIDITPHDGAPLPAPRRTLVSALAVGGAAAWAILESE